MIWNQVLEGNRRHVNWQQPTPVENVSTQPNIQYVYFAFSLITTGESEDSCTRTMVDHQALVVLLT